MEQNREFELVSLLFNVPVNSYNTIVSFAVTKVNSLGLRNSPTYIFALAGSDLQNINQYSSAQSACRCAQRHIVVVFNFFKHRRAWALQQNTIIERSIILKLLVFVVVGDL